MNLLVSALVAAFGAAAVRAVDIVLYSNNTSCHSGFASFGCFNVGAFTCCRPSMGDWPYFSGAKCEGLGENDTCAIARISAAGEGRPCGPICASAPGPGSVCVSADPCWAFGLSGFGMYWLAPQPAVMQECKRTVEPDRAVFANGRAFRINYDVPPHISALLVGLVRSDPHLARGVPAAAAPYEITAGKGS